MQIELGRTDIETVKSGGAVRPHRVKFQLTDACNARCLRCNVYNTRRDYLNGEVVRDTLEAIKEMGGQEVDFTGGEPTLHRQFGKLFEDANRLGLGVKVNTNGYLVDERLAKKMVRCGLREFAISIDSHEPGRHNAVRRLRDGWERAIKAVQYVDKYRRELGTNTNIVIYSIIDRYNYQDTPKMLGLKRVADFDEINFIPVKNAENKEGFLTPRELDDFYTRVRPVLLEEYAALGLKGIFRTVNDPFEILSSGSESHPQDGLYTEEIYKRISCVVPDFYAYIVSDGSVVPCCVAPHHLAPELIMGNVNTQGFKEVWDSDRFQQLRKELLKPHLEICKCCSGHHTAFNIDISRQVTHYEQTKSGTD